MEILSKMTGWIIITIAPFVVTIAAIGFIGYIGYKIGKFMEEWKKVKLKNDI